MSSAQSFHARGWRIIPVPRNSLSPSRLLRGSALRFFALGAEVAGEGVHYLRGPGILSVGGDFGSLTFGKADGPDGFFVSEGGTLSADASWSVGDTVTITAFAVSPEFQRQGVVDGERPLYGPVQRIPDTAGVRPPRQLR